MGACPALTGCAFLPAGATAQADQLHQVWSVFFYAGLFVAVVVYALILGPLFVWRRRGDGYPPQFRRNNKLEVFYTVVPLLIVAALFALTYKKETSVEQLVARPDATVDVIAFAWSWKFHYPGGALDIVGTPQKPPEMVIPVEGTTRINLTSTDVNHAFWVPGFLFKRDAIAGISNHFDLRPIRTGTYRGQCAEFCGLDHALMSFTIRVVSAADYRRWLQAHNIKQTASTGGP